MKWRRTLLLASLSCAASASAAEIEAIETPVLSARAKQLLASPPYAGGELPRGLDREFRNNCTQRASPFSLRGDFDADGTEDVAFWWLSAPTGEARVEARLLVHESRADRLVQLDQLRGQPARLPPLDLHAAGSRLYDHHRSASLRLAHDTVAVILCWKSAVAWLRRADGRYYEALTSD